jgi:RNA polymerase-binding transcription factor DksA
VSDVGEPEHDPTTEPEEATPPRPEADDPVTRSSQVADRLPGEEGNAEIDLDAIERDLDAVDVALDRLADGTYGTDEITGEAIPDSTLDDDPTARRA